MNKWKHDWMSESMSEWNAQKSFTMLERQPASQDPEILLGNNTHIKQSFNNPRAARGDTHIRIAGNFSHRRTQKAGWEGELFGPLSQFSWGLP